MSDWYMLTLVGKDKSGIVAAITRALFDAGLSLGEASMLRLGGNFSIMLMVSGASDPAALRAVLSGPVATFGLQSHVDAIDAQLHRHLVPNVQVRVCGADRAGIVADVTAALAEHGLNILELDSDVAGTQDNPVYVMHIQGIASDSVETLDDALQPLREQGIDVVIDTIETMVG